MNSTPPRVVRPVGPPPLLNLSRSFTVESIGRFLHNGNDINDQDNEDGSTLLMEAVARGKEDVVGFLLDQGANVNIQDHHGVTALGYYKDAIYKDGNLEKIVQMILEAGAWFLPDNDGHMINVMSENLYDELVSDSRYRNNNSPYSYGSYGNNSPNVGLFRRTITEEERAEQQEMANRYIAKQKAENNANVAWRASVGLPPSEREAVREYPPTTRRAKNIRDLIRLYVAQNVREVKLGSMSAGANKDKTIFLDLRVPISEIKRLIAYFFQYEFRFDLIYPAFHLAGKKILEDDRVLSDYGIRNGSRLLVVPKVQSGYRLGGTRRSKRKGKKTRSRRN